MPIPLTWHGSLGISAAPSESSGAMWIWGCLWRDGRAISTFWQVTRKKPLVPTCFCQIYFAEQGPRPGLKVGAAFMLVVVAVHKAVSVGNAFWSVLLCPSSGCAVRGRASCIPCPVPHTPYPASCIPHPMWDPVQRGLGALPASTGCTPSVLGKLKESQGALITGCPA